MPDQDKKTKAKASETTLVLSGINREFEENNTLKAAAEQKLSYVNIGKTPINPDYLRLIPYETSKKAKVLSFYKVGEKLRVAVVDPENPETKKVLDDLRAKSYKLNINLASSSGFLEALEKYEQTEVYKTKDIVEKVDISSIQTYEKEIAELKELEQEIPKVTAEEAINLINLGAMKTDASDVHYEPENEHVQIRFRIDGVLHQVFKIKHKEYKNILNRIKYQTKMKLNISDVPQDGRYDFKYNDRMIDVRVSVLPTENTETVVCRFLDSGKKFTSFKDLGFEGENLKTMEELLSLTQGMILVTGPTGSGKTTTLYSLLQGFNTPQKKIITLENPVEYHLDGVIQSQVNEKGDYNFAKGLKSILRQDPDIVMIGEIRDLETANTAAQASLTGHVLLATLHTNSAVESIPRLMNMGMDSFMTAPALDTLIAQRLVRKVCKHCLQKTSFSEEHKQQFDKAFENLKVSHPEKVPTYPTEIYVAKGCDKCSQTGYLGRLVIAEIIKVDAEMKELILKKASTNKILELARKKGLVTMQEDGFIKVAEGHTTIEEIYRVISLGS